MDEDHLHALDLEKLKEGKIFEFVDEDWQKRKIKVLAEIQKLMKKHPKLSAEELHKKVKSRMDELDLEEGDIRDDLKNRKFGLIKKVTKQGPKTTIEVVKISKINYHKHIDALAEHVANKLSKRNIKDMVKDALADAQLQPQKLQQLAERKEAVKVDTKKGCFNIVLDDKTVVPLR